MGVLGIIGMLIGIATLITLAFRGVHVAVASLVASLIVILTSGVDIWGTLTGGYAPSMTGFVGNFLILFLLGAIFGEFMSKSGYAKSIAYKLVDIFGANRGLLVVLVATALLTYGGVSVFVIIFSIYPIALYVLQEADIPKRIIPGLVNLGAGTFTMTMLPGSPAVTNVVPTSFLGTTTYAAPVLGCILAAIAAVVGYLYLSWEARRMKAAGEHFVPGPNDIIDPMTEESRRDAPPFIMGVLPIAIIFVINLIGSRSGLSSNYAVCLGMLAAIIFVVLTAWPRVQKKMECVNKGGAGSVMALMNTSCIVGFGGVIKAVPAFSVFTNFALSLPFAPIISAAVAINIIAAITGSSSGGLTIFMNMFAEHFMATGINPEVFHRLSAVAAGVFDSLPHAGPNVTFLMVCGLTYRESYKFTFVITCMVPLLCLIVGIILASLGVC